MALRVWDGKTVRLTDCFGLRFDGEAEFQSPAYCFHEYGREEPALQIDEWVFYEPDIRSVEEIGAPVLWASRLFHTVTVPEEVFSVLQDQPQAGLTLPPDRLRTPPDPGDVLRIVSEEDETDVWHLFIVSVDVLPDGIHLGLSEIE